jgi:hypothetical protein
VSRYGNSVHLQVYSLVRGRGELRTRMIPNKVETRVWDQIWGRVNGRGSSRTNGLVRAHIWDCLFWSLR